MTPRLKDVVWISLLSISLCLALQVSTECDPKAERDALLRLYVETGGDYWTNNSNWGSELPVSSWHGVSNDSAGCISELLLPANNLSGIFPPEMGRFSVLFNLQLSNNKGLHGNFSALASVTTLQILFLHDCSFTGPLVFFSNLWLLDVSFNALTGTIPVAYASVKTLRTFVVEDNMLSGTLPAFQTPFLTILAVYNNQLTGTLPQATFESMPFLKLCLVHGNQFTGPLPKLRYLPELTHVTFGESNHTGPFPELRFLPNLQEIFLMNTNISGTLPDQWSCCPSLKGLTVFALGIHGTLPSSLLHLPQLETLSITKMSGTLSTESGSILDNLSALRLVEFGPNNFTGPFPNLSKLHKLTQLRLQGGRLTGTVPVFNCSRLEMLLLTANNLNGTIPTWLGSCPHLQVLDLSQNSFTGNLPSEFRHLTELYHLNVGLNRLNGDPFSEVAKFPSLEIFNGTKNLFSSRELAFTHPKLTVIDMSWNQYHRAHTRQLNLSSGLWLADFRGNNFLCPYPTSPAQAIRRFDECSIDWNLFLLLLGCALIGGTIWILIVRYLLKRCALLFFLVVWVKRQVGLGLNIAFLSTTLPLVTPVLNKECNSANILAMFHNFIPILSGWGPRNQSFAETVVNFSKFETKSYVQIYIIEPFAAFCDDIGGPKKSCGYDPTTYQCVPTHPVTPPYGEVFYYTAIVVLTIILLQEVMRLLLLCGVLYRLWKNYLTPKASTEALLLAADDRDIAVSETGVRVIASAGIRHYIICSFSSPTLLSCSDGHNLVLEELRDSLGSRRLMQDFITQGVLETAPLLFLSYLYAFAITETRLSTVQLLSTILNGILVVTPLLRVMGLCCRAAYLSPSNPKDINENVI